LNSTSAPIRVLDLFPDYQKSFFKAINATLEQQLEAQSRPFRDELAELSIQAAEAKPGSLLSGESPSFRREFFNRHMKPV
jgi:hypothetical protein